jgi:hypothetical protein
MDKENVLGVVFMFFEDEGKNPEQLAYERSVIRSKKIIRLIKWALLLIVLPIFIIAFVNNMLWLYPGFFILLNLLVIYIIHKGNIK